MRVLCLHGLGTNSHILESQFQPIRSRLPPDWEFEFLDGEQETDPFPDIGEAYPGPYLCYYDGPSPQAVEAAVDLVLEVVSEDGPFDAVLGFSNGASLAATVIATAAERRPLDPPPFKAAVFVCSITPYRLKSGPLRLEFDSTKDDTLVSASRDDTPPGKPYDMRRDPEAAGIVVELEERRRLKRGNFGDGQNQWNAKFLLGYYAPVHGQRIPIPSVHVVGQEDHRYKEQGLRLVDLCDPRARKLITHAGGHHFPRDVATTIKVAQAIESVVEKAVLHSS